jgi:hypothetical protein
MQSSIPRVPQVAVIVYWHLLHEAVSAEFLKPLVQQWLQYVVPVPATIDSLTPHSVTYRKMSLPRTAGSNLTLLAGGGALITGSLAAGSKVGADCGVARACIDCVTGHAPHGICQAPIGMQHHVYRGVWPCWQACMRHISACSVQVHLLPGPALCGI